MNLSARTLGELKAIAKERGIPFAEQIKKADIIKAIEAEGSKDNVIKAPERKSAPPGVGTIAGGIIGSTHPNTTPDKTRPVAPKAVRPQEDPDKIAIYAEKNLYWAGVGKLDVGFNFVKKEVADKWLTHRAVREVSPEEVAAYYGV